MWVNKLNPQRSKFSNKTRYLSKLDVSIELRTTGFMGGFRFLSRSPLQSNPWNIIYERSFSLWISGLIHQKFDKRFFTFNRYVKCRELPGTICVSLYLEFHPSDIQASLLGSHDRTVSSDLQHFWINIPQLQSLLDSTLRMSSFPCDLSG